MIQLARVAVLLVLCSWAVSYAKRTPTVVPASAPKTEFSAERALVHLRRIASKPHPSGSEEHDAVLAYLNGEIRKLGLTPVMQNTTGIGTKYAVVGQVKNILVRVPGTQPGGQAVLLVAHHDGVGAGPAAGDDGAGTSALLEALRAVRAGSPLLHDVIFLWTDGEETGLLGAAAFAKEHPWAKDVAVILNFEARGVSGPSFMFETGRGNLDVARVLADVTDARATSLSTAVYRRLPNDTDLSELFVLDRPAMNFAFIGGVERYHTSEDDVAHLEPGSLQHHGAQALALARAFGNGPLPRPVTTDAVFFFFPGLGTFVYPEWLAVPFAVAALVLVMVAFALGRSGDKQQWGRSVVLGFTSALVTTAVGGIVGYELGAGFLKLHAAMGSGQSRFSDSYATAIAMGVIACTMLVHRLSLWGGEQRGVPSTPVDRQRNAAGAETGALIWWSLLSIVIAALLPGGSFLFTWPLIIAAIAAVVSARGSIGAPLLHWVAALVVIALVVPLAYSMVVVALGLDAVGGTMLGVLVAMGATLARPVLVAGTDRWWPIGAPLVVALHATVLGMTSVRTSAEHPVGADRVLAIDADSGRAYAFGLATGPVGTKWVSQVIGSQHLSGSQLPLWMQRMVGSRLATVAKPFASPLTAPRVMVLKDSSTAAGRMVLVRITPGAKRTLSIGIDVDSAQVLAATIDGRTVTGDRYRRQSSRWSLDFIAPPDSGFTLGLTLPAKTHAALNLAARVGGLVAWPISVTTRPPGVVAMQSGDMSVVHTSIALEMPAKRRR